MSEEERIRLKMNGLADSFDLFEDESIAVSVDSSLQFDSTKKKNRLALKIRFKNKTSEPIDDLAFVFEPTDGENKYGNLIHNPSLLE